MASWCSSARERSALIRRIIAEIIDIKRRLAALERK
jgi:hypothetical protein